MRYLIQSEVVTPLNQTLRVLTGASVQVNGSDGDPATIYVGETGDTQISNPLESTASGSFEFWAEPDDYLDLVITFDGSTETQRFYMGALPSDVASLEAATDLSTDLIYPEKYGAINGTDPDGREDFATPFLADLDKNTVTMRQILGSKYSPTNDGAATFNAFAAEIVDDGRTITDPDGTLISCEEPILLIDDLQIVGAGRGVTKFQRAFGGAGTAGNALFAHDDWAVNADRVVLKDFTAVPETPATHTGNLISLWGDDCRVEGVHLLDWEGGRAMTFGGDNFSLLNSSAYSEALSNGGAFRNIGGTGLNAYGLWAYCSDDCFQFVCAASAGNDRFGQSCIKGAYQNCYGISLEGRVFIVGLGGGDATPMDALMHDLSFIGIRGKGHERIANIENTQGNPTIHNQIDNISAIGCHITGDTHVGGVTQAFHIHSDWDGGIGTVNVESSSFKGHSRARGIEAENVGQLNISQSEIEGEVHAIYAYGTDQDDVDDTIFGTNVHMRDTALRIIDNGGGQTGSHVVRCEGTSRLLNDGNTFNDTPTGAAAIRLTDTAQADIRGGKYRKASGATGTSIVSGVAGTTVKTDGPLSDSDLDDLSAGSPELNITGNGLLSGKGAGLTIASGEITITHGQHVIDTEASASTDTLETINGGVNGATLTITSQANNRDITFSHGVGNIQCVGSVDVTTTNSDTVVTLMLVDDVWRLISTVETA